MGAQKFNFGPKFPENKGFSAPNFAHLEENFPTKRKFYDSLVRSSGPPGVRGTLARVHRTHWI